MRFGPRDKFFVVRDPSPFSELVDIVMEVSLVELEAQFRGGMTIAENPTIFTNRTEAEADAHARLVASRVAQAVLRGGGGEGLRHARSVELHDAEGAVIFKASLANSPHGSGLPR